jgi:hypothetical protein
MWCRRGGTVLAAVPIGAAVVAKQVERSQWESVGVSQDGVSHLGAAVGPKKRATVGLDDSGEVR